MLTSILNAPKTSDSLPKNNCRRFLTGHTGARLAKGRLQNQKRVGLRGDIGCSCRQEEEQQAVEQEPGLNPVAFQFLEGCSHVRSALCPPSKGRIWSIESTHGMFLFNRSTLRSGCFEKSRRKNAEPGSGRCSLPHSGSSRQERGFTYTYDPDLRVRPQTMAAPRTPEPARGPRAAPYSAEAKVQGGTRDSHYHCHGGQCRYWFLAGNLAPSLHEPADSCADFAVWFARTLED